MAVARSDVPTPRKPLRLWPGVVALVLLWLARFGLKVVIPGFKGFEFSVIGGALGFLAVVIWWALFSRAPRFERWGAPFLITAALLATLRMNHESMGPVWLIAYALPVLSLVFVAWAVASRRLSDGSRRATMVATVLVACGAWTAVRTDGLTGDHVEQFKWRWTKTVEEQLLVNAADRPAALPSAPATINAAADWPGFRGPGRDSIIHGVRIATDWSARPPVQLWRRPIGPGWSSFAVRGDLLYTQEQRGDEEIVAAYRVTTGRPVWTHRDATRFFESNGGAGPRATPTLSGGRVYTFGATGIVNALDARDGSLVWSRNAVSDTGVAVPIWGFASSPLVIGDLVVVAAAGQLVAYDLPSGHPRWTGPSGGGSYKFATAADD